MNMDTLKKLRDGILLTTSIGRFWIRSEATLIDETFSVYSEDGREARFTAPRASLDVRLLSGALRRLLPEEIYSSEAGWTFVEFEAAHQRYNHPIASPWKYWKDTTDWLLLFLGSRRTAA